MSNSSANEAKVLIVPGLYNSSPQHWQRIWAAHQPTFRVIEQQDWNTPSCDDWTATVDAAVREESRPVVLVGHSMGCMTIIQWALRYPRPLAGALLVAPSDTEADSFPIGTRGFAPIPLERLPFPSIVIASSNDKFVSLARAQHFATSWGSSFVNLGPQGHITAADGFGAWPEGSTYLEQLRVPR